MTRKILLASSLILLFCSTSYCKDKDISAPQKKDWQVRLKKTEISGLFPGAEKIRGLTEPESPNQKFEEWPSPAEVGPFELDLNLTEHRGDNLLLVVEFTKPIDEKNIPILVRTAKVKGKSYKKLMVTEVVVTKTPDPSERGRGQGRRGGRRGLGGNFGARFSRFPQPLEARIELSRKKFNWVQLKFGRAEASPRIKRLRIYKLNKKGKNDYWLFIGSTMFARAGNVDALETEIRDRFKEQSPYVVNLSRESYSAAQLKSDIQKILREHKHARYVVMHVGGVDVSTQRPFPKGSEKLKNDLEVILKAIKKSKKIPVLSRISYRAYTARGNRGAVPPLANGSGPYNSRIVDPLINKYCRPFVDKGLKLGYLDLYTPYMNKPQLLDKDGVTFSAEGYFLLKEIILRRVFATVYLGKAQELPKPDQDGDEDGENKPDSPDKPQTP